MAAPPPRPLFRQGGFNQPKVLSQKMIDFFNEADLGPLYNSTGEIILDDINDALIFLNCNVEGDPNAFCGISTHGVNLILMATYVKHNNLVRLARINQEKEFNEYDGNWFGADHLLLKYFGTKIDTIARESQQHMAAYGEVEGQLTKRDDKGRIYTGTAGFYLHGPDMLSWSDISKLISDESTVQNDVVNPNLEQFRERNVDDTQLDQLDEYYDLVEIFHRNHPGHSIAYVQYAIDIIGNGSNDNLEPIYAANPPLYARMIIDNLSQELKISNKIIRNEDNHLYRITPRTKSARYQPT